jgi:hypothetical protein
VALLEHPVDVKIDRGGWQPSELRRVVLRLTTGEVIQVGTAPNRESAITLARSVIEEVEHPSGEWPLINDRVMRPDAVISVDVLQTT